MISRSKLLLPFILFCSISIFLMYGLQKNPSRIPSPLIGKPAPIFKARNVLHSKQFITNSIFHNNQVSVLNVFSIYCIACEKEHSILMTLHQRHPDLRIYGLSFMNHRKQVVHWLNKNGNPYHQVLLDPMGNIGIDFGVYGTPETFIIDNKGIIRFKYIGPINHSALKNKIIPQINKIKVM